jgi:hypothetical protein
MATSIFDSGSEQGLSGHKDAQHQDDSMVREALWGKLNFRRSLESATDNRRSAMGGFTSARSQGMALTLVSRRLRPASSLFRGS